MPRPSLVLSVQASRAPNNAAWDLFLPLFSLTLGSLVIHPRKRFIRTVDVSVPNVELTTLLRTVDVAFLYVVLTTVLWPVDIAAQDVKLSRHLRAINVVVNN